MNKNVSKMDQHFPTPSFFSKSRKRGQMEVIGLVIIVLLISLGMIFMAIFALKSTDSKKIFTRKELAASTLTAILRTTVDDPSCYRVDDPNHVPLPLGERILDDCIAHDHPRSPSDYNCAGADGTPKHSCEFLKDTFTTLLDRSLGEGSDLALHKRYQLKVEVIPINQPHWSPFDPIMARGGCEKSTQRDSSKPFPLQVEGIGVVYPELYICD